MGDLNFVVPIEPERVVCMDLCEERWVASGRFCCEAGVCWLYLASIISVLTGRGLLEEVERATVEPF